MRGVLYALSVIAVIGLAYWAYGENYRTQTALSEVRALEREIADLREALSVQRAEWAYLNRPERLRELAFLNFETLGLMPMHADQFGNIDQIAYPQPGLPSISGAVSLTAQFSPNITAKATATSPTGEARQ
jgi:hypothetical protein